MSKKGCFGKYNFAILALEAHITPSIHFSVQNLVNNCPLLNSPKFTPSYIFLCTVDLTQSHTYSFFVPHTIANL